MLAPRRPRAGAHRAPDGTFQEFPIPSGVTPYLITASPDGSLWFTSDWLIGRITTAGDIRSLVIASQVGVATDYPGTAMPGIVVDPAGMVWFTEPNVGWGRIARLTPPGYGGADPVYEE